MIQEQLKHNLEDMWRALATHDPQWLLRCATHRDDHASSLFMRAPVVSSYFNMCWDNLPSPPSSASDFFAQKAFIHVTHHVPPHKPESTRVTLAAHLGSQARTNDTFPNVRRVETKTDLHTFAKLACQTLQIQEDLLPTLEALQSTSALYLFWEGNNATGHIHLHRDAHGVTGAYTLGGTEAALAQLLLFARQDTQNAQGEWLLCPHRPCGNGMLSAEHVALFDAKSKAYAAVAYTSHLEKETQCA